MNIKYVYCDDWEVIYVNNKKYTEGHHIGKKYWFKLGQENPDIKFEDIKHYECDNDKMEELCYWEFHENFNDIPKEIFYE